MRNATFGPRFWSLDHTSTRMLSLVVALAGLWQIVAPFLLNFTNEQMAMRNAIGAGIALVLFAGLGAFGVGRLSSAVVSAFNWLACLTGLWLLISPSVLQYREIAPAFWSAIVVGLLSFIVAGYAASQKEDSDASVSI